MKDFLKYALASLTGFVVLVLIVGIIGAVSIAGMVASSKATPSVSDNSVFVLKLDGLLSERSTPNFVAMIKGEPSSLGLDNILSSIKKAKDNDKIKGIYIEMGAFLSDAPASSQAIRNALLDFKKSGKWIVAYADAYGQMGYYLASAADKVYINPQGAIDWHGLGGSMMYYKDALAKFGVKVAVTKVGKYKSAPEQYASDHMSEPNREQTQAYIDGIWDDILTDVSQSRHISKERLNVLADSLMTFASTDVYLKEKLIDKTLYADEVRAEIKKRLGIDADDKINQLSLDQMTLLPDPDRRKGDEIAVYYAFGDIVDTQPASMSGGNFIAADKVCADLEKLADDDHVKAVVLRVNSPGGSAYASEQMWHYIDLLKKKKPVVVSMGGYAASGGYYMSSGASYIYAEPTTLTGSIGIFGVIPDASELLTQKLGVKFEEVKTNRHSNFGTIGAFGSMARPLTGEEMSMLNAYVGRGYNLFLKRVADGRKLTLAQADAVAQGRVWLGQDALKHKLVDALGGLDEAVAKAAQLAGVKEYYTSGYPAAADWMEQLTQAYNQSSSNYLDERLRAVLGDCYETFSVLRNISQMDMVQARMPYSIIIK